MCTVRWRAGASVGDPPEIRRSRRYRWIMAGRHAASRAATGSLADGRRRRTGRIVATLVGVVVLAGGGTAAVLATRSNGHPRSVAAPTCSGEVSVPVLAAPTVQSA